MSINPYSIYDADMSAYGMQDSPYMASYQHRHPSQLENFDSVSTNTVNEPKITQDTQSTWSPKTAECPNKKSKEEMTLKVVLFIMLVAFIAYAYVSTLLKITSLTERVNILQGIHTSV